MDAIELSTGKKEELTQQTEIEDAHCTIVYYKHSINRFNALKKH
jgi:hypothetical protein